MIKTDKYLFFWGGELSNFYGVSIDWNGTRFKNSEQIFMYEKAMYFKDYGVAAGILRAETPGEAKKLGRLVKGYVDEEWAEIREDLMEKILFAKFGQTRRLMNFLSSTSPLILVEASPYDKIWGIGMAELDKGIEDEANWKGQNLLGQVLMRVREKLCVGQN